MMLSGSPQPPQCLGCFGQGNSPNEHQDKHQNKAYLSTCAQLYGMFLIMVGTFQGQVMVETVWHVYCS